MRVERQALVFSALWAALACAAAPDAPVSMRLEIPPEVARHAAARSRGDASAPPPILMLEGLRVGRGEALTIEVLGPRENGQDGPVLAVAGLVGSGESDGKASEECVDLPMNLVVPLNDVAARLLAGQREIELRLRVVGSPGRAALAVDRAYFEPGTTE